MCTRISSTSPSLCHHCTCKNYPCKPLSPSRDACAARARVASHRRIAARPSKTHLRSHAVRDFIQQANLCNFTTEERDNLRQKVQNFQSTGASISDLSQQQRDAARQRFESSVLSRCNVSRDALQDWERRFPGPLSHRITQPRLPLPSSPTDSLPSRRDERLHQGERAVSARV